MTRPGESTLKNSKTHPKGTQIDTHCHNCWVMEVDDAFNVRSGSMDGRVEHEAGHTDAKVGGATLDDVPLHVHLDKGGGRHLMVQHAERVEQEVFCVLADAGLWLGRQRSLVRVTHIRGK